MRDGQHLAADRHLACAEPLDVSEVDEDGIADGRKAVFAEQFGDVSHRAARPQDLFFCMKEKVVLFDALSQSIRKPHAAHFGRGEDVVRLLAVAAAKRERLLQLDAEQVVLDRLDHKIEGVHLVAADGVLCERRDEDEADGGVDGAQAARRLQPVHVRHRDVEQHDVECAAVILEKAHAVAKALGSERLLRLVRKPADVIEQHLCICIFIFNNGDADHTPSSGAQGRVAAFIIRHIGLFVNIRTKFARRAVEIKHIKYSVSRISQYAPLNSPSRPEMARQCLTRSSNFQ